MEHLADYHFVAIYVAPKGYKEIGKALNRTQQRARRAGGRFEYLLLQSNEVQILFIDSRSSPEVKEWLDKEPYFELVALMPTIEERNRWLEIGLERMDKPMHWNHKVRHSKGIASIKASVDDVNNTHSESITSSTEPEDRKILKALARLTMLERKVLEQYGSLMRIEDGEKVFYFCDKVNLPSFFGYQWDSVDKTLEELVTEQEAQGYTTDWLTGNIVRFIPPKGRGNG